MLQRIVGLVVAVAGVLFAFLVGLWTLVFLGLVAAGAALVHGLRTRGGSRGDARHREVIEGEFTVVDGAPHEDRERERSTHPPATRK